MLLLSVSQAGAADYYVDGNIVSSGSGTSWASAKMTIAEGVSLLNSGDTLKIASGTYNEPIVIDGKTFGSETRIETDDKTGNPGIVTLTGRTNAGGHYSVVYFHNVGDITLDGRQSVIEGDSYNGFVLNPVSAAAGVLVNEYGAVGTVRILRVEVAGSKPLGDIGTIGVLYARDVEIAYNQLHQTGGNDGDVIILNGDYSPGPAPLSGSIHHNDVSGNPSNGYGAITQKRTNGVDVFNNYIHNVGGGGVGVILRDFQFVGSDSGDVYNNVIVNNGNMRIGIQIRGMTAGEGGGTDNSRVFSNTIHDTNGFSDGMVFSVNDDSDNNEIFNNLIIGNVNNLVGNFGDNEGSGNQIYNNVITGSMGSTFESSGVQGMFSVSSPNTANAGTSSINLQGSIPDEYYSLTGSLDGTGTDPDTDYLGNSRSDPPDAGAFEYGGAPLTCSEQGYYCCPSGYECSQTRTGTGCGIGETCCLDQSSCTQDLCGNSLCDAGECNTCPGDCTAQDCLDDGTCQSSFGETCETTTDCACLGSELCCSGICQAPACSLDSDCGSAVCTTYICSNPGTCSASCSSVQITQCIDSDECCPGGCTEVTDNDCTPQTGTCQDMIFLYHLDQNLVTQPDSSGSGNDATVSGATYTSSGRFSGAYSFSSDQQITTSSITLPNQFTYSIWIYPLSSSNWATILTDQSSTRWLGLGDMVLEWYDSSDNYFGSTITANTWHHVAVTSDGSSLVVYLDGSPAGSPLSRTYTSTTDTFIIGNNQWDEYFQGTVDEVAIWSRSFSGQEISTLYNSGSPITCSSQTYHPADNNPEDGCIDGTELTNYISLWQADSTTYPMRVMMEAVELYLTGTGCY